MSTNYDSHGMTTKNIVGTLSGAAWFFLTCGIVLKSNNLSEVLINLGGMLIVAAFMVGIFKFIFEDD